MKSEAKQTSSSCRWSLSNINFVLLIDFVVELVVPRSRVIYSMTSERVRDGVKTSKNRKNIKIYNFSSNEWKNSLFSCFNAPVDCLVGTFLPCITIYQAATKAQQGPVSSVFYACCPILLPALRNAVRRDRGIDVS
jgi:hypothetical protein